MKKKFVKGHTLALPIIIGCCVSVFVSLISLGIGATLVINGTLPLKDHSFAIYILQFLAFFLGTMTACLLAKERKLIAVIAVLGITMFLLFFVTILFYGGEFGNVLPSLLACLLGGGGATLIQWRTKSTRKMPKKFRAYR